MLVKWIIPAVTCLVPVAVGVLLVVLFPWLFASLFGMFVVSALVLAAFDALRCRIQVSRYYRANDGTTWLVWHRRRDWNELMINNVLPVLEGAVPLEDRSPVFTTTNPRRRLEWTQGYVQVRRPYLLRLHRGRFTQISLNERLQHLKKRSARSAAVQEEVRQILKQALAELPKKP